MNFSFIFGKAHAEIKEKQLAFNFYSQKPHWKPRVEQPGKVVLTGSQFAQCPALNESTVLIFGFVCSPQATWKVLINLCRQVIWWLRIFAKTNTYTGMQKYELKITGCFITREVSYWQLLILPTFRPCGHLFDVKLMCFWILLSLLRSNDFLINRA